MNRRGFLGVCLALGVAPYVVKAEALMRVRPILRTGWIPLEEYVDRITEFKRTNALAGGFSRVIEVWYENEAGFLLPTGRLDEPGEYRGTAKLWDER